MFADAGAVNQEYAVLTDGSTKYYDPATFEQQLRSLSESEIFALQNSANSGQISFSPGLQSILSQVINRKQIPAFEDDPSVDTTYSSPLLGRDPVQNTQSYKSIGGDFGRVAKGIYGPVLSSLVRNTMPKEALDDSTSFGIPGIGGASLKSIAEYDSPFFGEGVQGFEEAGARGGRTREELDAILSGGLQTIPGQQIQDFQSEIDDVVDTATVTEVNNIRMDGTPIPQAQGPDLERIAEENNMTIEQVERIVAEQKPLLKDSFDKPNFSSVDDFGDPLSSGETLSFSGGVPEMEARRLEYQKEMIGRDEFGNLLPEGRPKQDDEIATLLEEIKPIEQKVDVDKTEADTLADNEAKFGGLSQDEFRATIDDAAIPKLPEIERPITDTTIVEEEERRKQNDPVSRKLDQPGFFGSDRFLNFIRNVGGELVRTGQFGEGLASGAAKASEERAARELMADKEERDYRMKLRLAKAEADLEARNKLAEGMKPSDIKTFTEFEDDIAGSLSQFDESERIVSDINQILNEDIKETGAFGAQGFVRQISDKFRNLAGYGETDWNKLDPAVRTQVILDVTAQRSVRQILGESGKTISNLDRDIVARIFGKVGVFTSPAELSKLLTNSRDNIVESMRKDQSLVISRANAIGLGGYNSPTLMANESLINRILGFSFDNIQNYKLGDDAAGYIEATL